MCKGSSTACTDQALSAAVPHSCRYLVLTSMPSMAAAAPVMASLDKVILSNLKQFLRASFV